MQSDKLKEFRIKKPKLGIKEKNYMRDKDYTYSAILMVISTGWLSTDF